MKNIVSQFRAFSRYYTDIVGLLNKNFLNSPYSLPEVRVMFEISHRNGCTSTDIISAIHIDRGYLSRILSRFHKSRLICRERSSRDAREVYLSLSTKGEKIFGALNKASQKQAISLLKGIPAGRQKELVSHMNAIRKILPNKK